MVTGYLASAFDLLNVGDLDVIAQAVDRCDRLVVGVLTDERVAELTGGPPYAVYADRAAVVSHVRGVDAVVESDGQTIVPAVDIVFGSNPVDVTFDTSAGVQHLVLEARRRTASQLLLGALGPYEREVA